MNARAHPVTTEDLLAHAEWLRRLAACLVRDPDRANDVAQETWRHALERPPRVRDDLRGWLAVAARRVAQQLRRSERARAGRERCAARDEATPSAADLVVQASLERELAARVLDLEEPYRTAVLLRYFRELTPPRIADELGLPLNTVRSHLGRGLAQLRRRLDAEAGGREAWMRAFGPLALLGPEPAGRALAWLPAALGGAAATLAAVAVTAQLGRAPARDTDPATIAAHAPHALVARTEIAAAPRTLPAASLAARITGPSVPQGRRATGNALAPGPGDPGPGAAGEGVLDLSFLDARTGEPLVDLDYCVFQERGGNRLYQRGTSDARGRARVEGLPENTILVQTARRPPLATGFAAVWLRGGERRSLDVRVGTGGRFVGRVVDDRSEPVAGVELAMETGSCACRSLRDAPVETAVVARTDADGRFAIDAVGELPRGVWVVDGEPRPERWLAWEVSLRSDVFPGQSLAGVSGTVRAGDTLDLGDVELPRPVTLSGRVLDDGGHPVAGALVSLSRSRTMLGRPANDWRRTAVPGSADFELQPAEALTGADGGFLLRAPWYGSSRYGSSRYGSSRRLLVRTPAGHDEHFPGPSDVEPGEQREGIELVVPSGAIPVIALRGLDGLPVDLGALGPGMMQRGRYLGLAAFSRALVLLSTVQGDLVALHASPASDGLLRLSTDVPARDVRAFDVFAPDYLPEHRELPDGFPAEPVVVALRPQPRVRVRVELAPGTHVPRHDPLRVRVGACRAGPERIPADKRWSSCCGFGCVASIELGAQPVDVDLPIATDEPYWVTVYGHHSGSMRLPSRVLGPVAPSETADVRHVVVVDPRDLRPYERDPAAVAREERAPPERARPDTARRVQALRALGYVGTPDEDAGDAMGHPDLAVRVLEADGTPLAGGTGVLLVGSPGKWFGLEGTVGSDGLARFRADLPPRLVLAAPARLGGFGGDFLTTSTNAECGFQILEVDGWSPGVPREVVLAPWRTVELVATGLSDEDVVLHASAFVTPVTDLLPSDALPSPVRRTVREVAPDSPRTRRFRIQLPAGPWTATARIGLHTSAPTPLDVRDTEETQRFELPIPR